MMKYFVFATVTLALATIGSSEKIRYDGYKLVQLHIDSEDKLNTLEKLEKLPYFETWGSFALGNAKNVEIFIGPKELRKVQPILTKFNITTKILQDNIQEIIDSEAKISTLNAEEFGWKSYHTLDEINKWIDGVVSTYNDVVTPFVIGKSYEGREIRGIKISYKAGNSGIFLESNIHAREWITSATCTYFINELLTSTRADIREIAENIDWYIIPVFNVDGFAYSHEKDRLWRKTRRPSTIKPECPGADPNRNFDSHWMENGGATDYPCDETYGGTAPFSEIECKNLAEYVSSIKDKIGVYLAYHSYGQYILTPYGHTRDEVPPNYDDLYEVAKASNDAIAAVGNGISYRYGSTSQVLYIASGSSVDYAYNELGIKLGFTFEFRDQGKYGFVLPSAHIIPNAIETVEAMIALVRKSQELEYL